MDSCNIKLKKTIFNCYSLPKNILSTTTNLSVYSRTADVWYQTDSKMQPLTYLLEDAIVTHIMCNTVKICMISFFCGQLVCAEFYVSAE